MEQEMTEAVDLAIAYSNARAIIKRLKEKARYLTTQEYRTLKGQALAGDIEGAEKGLETILQRKQEQKQCRAQGR